MNLFECELCGNKDPQDHEELVEHIVTAHTDYTDTEAIYYANLWEKDKLEELEEAEIYE